MTSIEKKPYHQFRRFQNLQYLRKDQLKLANDYICEMMEKDYEYYYMMYRFAMLAFNALKIEKSVRCGMTLCKNKTVDFICDYRHDDCPCTDGLKEKIHSI